MLDTPTQSGPPKATFPTVGDWAVYGVVDVEEYQQRDMDTDKLEVWPDGKPKMGKLITAILVSHSEGFVVGGIRNPQPPVAGDLVTIWGQGGTFTAYRDAVRASGGIDVGYVIRQERIADGVPSNPKWSPPQKYTMQIRPGDPAKDGDLAQRCRAAYEARNRVQLDTAPAASPAPSATSNVEF